MNEQDQLRRMLNDAEARYAGATDQGTRDYWRGFGDAVRYALQLHAQEDKVTLGVGLSLAGVPANHHRVTVVRCDCIASGNASKPKQHGADPHAKNCAVYTRRETPSVPHSGPSLSKG
jgi:hypothetical protein